MPAMRYAAAEDAAAEVAVKSPISRMIWWLLLWPAAAVLARLAARLAVRDQCHVDDPRVDRGQRVVDVHHERAAADRGTVDVTRVDAEVLRDLRGQASGEHALDLGGLDAGLPAD